MGCTYSSLQTSPNLLVEEAEWPNLTTRKQTQFHNIPTYILFSEISKKKASKSATVKQKLTKLISLSSNTGSYVCRNLSDVGEWWVYESLVKVLLAHL